MAHYIMRGGIVVNQDGMQPTDVALADGKIVALGSAAKELTGELIDCAGLHILPGVIDTQVHFREPGAEHKENLETGSLAAVMGGVTGVFEMPNTAPPTTNAAALADKVQRARHRMHCDFAFWVGATNDNIAQLPILEQLEGAAGIKVFAGSSTGSLLVEDETVLAAILARSRRRCAFHSEDEARLRERSGLRVAGDPLSHTHWRDEEAALISTQRLVKLARLTGARIHILHVSSAAEMAFLAAHKDYASVEVTPHHLTLSTQEHGALGTHLQMNPPVRDNWHREALWRGVETGVADILGSDHAPHTLEEKAKPYPQSPSGMPGVETLVPVMLNHINAGRMSLSRFVDMSSAGPARLFGLRGKGRLAVGYDADLTVVDMARQVTINAAHLHSRAGWSPYQGQTMTGWPVGTFVRGAKVMWQGKMVEAATGEPIRFA